MRYSILALAVVSSFARAECEADMSGATRTHAGPGLPLVATCAACRNANQFPEDMRNFVYNYFQHGAGNIAWQYNVNTRMLDSPVQDMTLPVRNTHGQVGSATLRTRFNTIGISRHGINAYLNLGVASFQAIVVLDNGESSATGQLANGHAPLRIPATTAADPKAGACLNNEGRNVRRRDMVPAGDRGDQHWNRFPQLWPSTARRIHRYCGNSFEDSDRDGDWDKGEVKGARTCKHAIR